MNNLYAVLGVSETATGDELKRAYRTIARQSHPDRNPGDPSAEARFKAAAEAYRVLADPDARRAYDAEHRSPPARPVADVTSAVGHRPKRWVRLGERGDDLRYTVRLTFAQAALGSTETLELPDDAPCSVCDGTGAAPGAATGACPDCEGDGQRAAATGFFGQAQECSTCRGTGRVVRKTCTACAGLGIQPRARQVAFDIPGGVEDGARLRLTGEGRPGTNGGPSGDLIVVVNVEAHPFFERRGADIFMEMPVSIAQAVLGTQVEIPTLDGLMRMKIPPGTQNGRIFRLKGQGLRQRGSAERGDQKVRVVVHIPETLSVLQRELMERWSELEALDDPHEVGAYRAALRKLYS